MDIRYLQKTTLIDYPGKIACTLFIQGCNLKCGYCHNPELISFDQDVPSLSESEVISFLKKRRNQLEGVCITGGEPLLSLTLDFLVQIKELGYAVKIDTNGTCPEKLDECLQKGVVDYVAMDIKSCPQTYTEVAGVPLDLTKIERSISSVLDSSVSYELRTTIIRSIHTPECVREMITWISGCSTRRIERFVLQGFQMRGKVLDISYEKTPDTEESYLQELLELIKPSVETVEYRY